MVAKHFTIYNFDRRGRGESGDTEPYAVAREIEDVGALITYAKELVFLYGHSAGAFDPRALKALGVYRDWMEHHSAAIYGCTQSEFSALQDCRLTQNGKKLYVHVLALQALAPAWSGWQSGICPLPA